MKRLNLTGMIALTFIWCCGAVSSAALIGTDNVRSGIEDVVSIGMMRGWISESGTEFQTNETTLSLSSEPIFIELFAWHKNVDLFSAKNLIGLACRYSLESKTAVLENLPVTRSYRPLLSRTTVKAIPSGLFMFGIVGWAVRRLRRTGHSFN